MTSRFVEGVWVGHLGGQGFVVFDPEIPNLFAHSEGRSSVYLWVVGIRRWSQFDVEAARAALRNNLMYVTEFARDQIAASYWAWKCHSSGADGNTRADYEYEQLEQDHVLKMVALEDEEWLGRLQALHRGEDPNS